MIPVYLVAGISWAFLGDVIASRFDVILDYKKKVLYFKPNSDFEDTFEFPVSEFELKKVDEEVIVSKIILDSAVNDLGMREGDRIPPVNKNMSNDLATYQKMLTRIIHDYRDK